MKAALLRWTILFGVLLCGSLMGRAYAAGVMSLAELILGGAVIVLSASVASMAIGIKS